METNLEVLRGRNRHRERGSMTVQWEHGVKNVIYSKCPGSVT